MTTKTQSLRGQNNALKMFMLQFERLLLKITICIQNNPVKGQCSIKVLSDNEQENTVNIDLCIFILVLVSVPNSSICFIGLRMEESHQE